MAEETRELMQNIVSAGEADALVPDRVWKETEAALAGPYPRVYFESLRDCGALEVVFPEIEALFGVPQPEQWHPEIDSGLHTMMVLEQACALSQDVDVRFAALVHDLGKATTDKRLLPRHPGHELRGKKLIEKMSRRLPIPKACRELALGVAEFHAHCHRAFELRDSTVLKVLERTDAFRRPGRFEKFLLACEADARGRTGLENRDYRQADMFRAAFSSAAAVDTKTIAADNEGPAIAAAIRKARCAAIRRAREAFPV